MKFEEKEITLKNGQRCILRSPTGEDAEAILSYLRKTSGETPFMARYEDEAMMTVEEESDFLSAILADSGEIMISAFVNGKLIANSGLSKIAPREKYRHRTEFGISIIKEFWNEGLGSTMLSAIIESAKAADYEQLELEVVTQNERAIALYKKFGFEIYGTRERSFKFRDGSYSDAHLMLKRL